MTVKQKIGANELIPLLIGIMRLINTRLSHPQKDAKEIFSPVQWHTLYFIKRKKNPLMKEVADFLGITPPSATSLIDGLVESNLLKRNFDKNDRRVVRLAVTTRGKQTLRQGLDTMTGQMKKILACLTQKEQKQLFFIYKKVLISLTSQ